MELKEKIIDFLGDSITEGVGVENCETGRYDNIIKARCGLKAVYNYGIGGTRIAHQRIPSDKARFDLCFCGRAYDLNPDADIIVVYGGVNDYIHGDAPIGNLGDNTPATFCGGVEHLMSLLEEMYPSAQKVFMTPAHMCLDNLSDAVPSEDARKHGTEGKPLAEYVKIVEETGKKHGIPVLNLYERLPINPNIPEQRDRFTADGLHLNDAGHRVLADLLIDFIENEV